MTIGNDGYSQDIEILKRQIAAGREEFLEFRERVSRGGGGFGVPGVFSTQPSTPQSASAPNMIRNGDINHSVGAYNDAVVPIGDRSLEAAHFFSHSLPVNGQELFETFDPTNPNNALKDAAHSAYDVAFCDWWKTVGYARINGTHTVDVPLSSNYAKPGVVLHVTMIAAKLDAASVFPANTRMYAGIWDNTAGQRDWIRDTFEMTAQAVGTPAGTTERRYRILAQTDRGFELLTDEVIEVNAPNDASFSNENNVVLSWGAIGGALKYTIYRFTPSTGVYDILEEVDSGATNFIDLNTKLPKTPLGYPAVADNERKALFYTRDAELQDLAVDGVSSAWSTVDFPVYIPQNYQSSNTTGKQWLRIGLTDSPSVAHSVGIDFVHVSYIRNALYSPHPDDQTRTLLPDSNPDGSSQGGIQVPTDGDTSGGGIRPPLDLPGES